MAMKVTIRRTATRKDSASKGMVSSFTKTNATASKLTTSSSRATSGFKFPKNVSIL